MRALSDFRGGFRSRGGRSRIVERFGLRGQTRENAYFSCGSSYHLKPQCPFKDQKWPKLREYMARNLTQTNASAPVHVFAPVLVTALFPVLEPLHLALL